MRQFPHTKRNHRSGNWVYFRRIPQKVQALSGRPFFERSLRTADRSKLSEPWAQADFEFNELIRRLEAYDKTPHAINEEAKFTFDARTDFAAWKHRKYDTGSRLDLDLSKVRDSLKHWMQDELYTRAQNILNDPQYLLNEEQFMIECQHVGACNHNRNWLIHSPFLYNLTRKIIAEYNIAVPVLHAAQFTIESMVEQNFRLILEAEGRWRNGEFADMPDCPPARTHNVATAPNGKAHISLKELTQLYTATTRKPKKTCSKLDLVTKYIYDLTENDLTIDKLTKETLIELQKLSQHVPARMTNAEKLKNFRSLAMQAQITDDSRAKLTPQVVRAWFNLLGGCFNWAVAADLMHRNPVTGIKPKVKTTEEGKRDPYIMDDLVRIFDKDVYPNKTDHSKFWIPLIALFTGARLNEIGQLYRVDIIRQPVPSIVITDEN